MTTSRTDGVCTDENFLDALWVIADIEVQTIERMAMERV